MATATVSERYRARRREKWESNDGEKAVEALAVEFGKHIGAFLDFHPAQLEAMRAINERRVTVAKIATGGGKTLIFFGSLKLLGGIGLLLVPMNVIVRNHVRACPPGVRVVCLPDLCPLERSVLLRDIGAAKASDPPLAIVGHPGHFLADDMMAAFRVSVARQAVSIVCVDEANLVVEWGHDFRPEFQQIGRLRDVLRLTPQGPLVLGPSLLVLEAACTQQGLEAILTGLGVTDQEQEDMVVVSTSTDRPELKPVVLRLCVPDPAAWHFKTVFFNQTVCARVLLKCVSSLKKLAASHILNAPPHNFGRAYMQVQIPEAPNQQQGASGPGS